MAPAYAIPRMLARNDVAYHDIALWEITRRSPRKCCATSLPWRAPTSGARKRAWKRTSASFRGERLNPHGGSVALGQPSPRPARASSRRRVKELAAMPKGSRAVVSICADGGLGTVALLQQNDSRNESATKNSRR